MPTAYDEVNMSRDIDRERKEGGGGGRERARELGRERVGEIGREREGRERAVGREGGREG